MEAVTSQRIDGTEVRRVFGCFPSGVIAVCAMVDGEPVGMAASSFTTVSLMPPLVSICVQHNSATWPRLRRCPALGVSVLAEDHTEACRSLSRKHGDRFAGVHCVQRPSGGVFVDGASAWLDCSLNAEIPAGDHVIVLLGISALRANPDTLPLVFHRSQFHRLAATAGANEQT
ncbi:flavin reductase family protein [Mycobacterium nebraskense]|uniref:Flavin reductase n=1 Tax=Mycobacterium nebraskense TaxID=244292 RepID=A0A1X1ZMY5_9MYCO|nr:flavin reductase family protein [Mycobacterium nebraskense]KKC05649.1 flavin reductase [Mycobacterium nebraskense]MBI2693596.1 flavin reductase family protein [Mycobacterium nebraskense]ORW24759.1 flavin reductase [Mycobacterium nebraskense]